MYLYFHQVQKVQHIIRSIFQSNLSQMETMLRAKGGGEEALSQDQERLLHRELQVFIFVKYFEVFLIYVCEILLCFG